MSERYVIKPDVEFEQFKILDTRYVVGGDDPDYVWVASAYEEADAEHICLLLNANPHGPILK